MLKRFFFIFFLGINLAYGQSIYSFTVQQLEGGNYSLTDCQGKKILFVLLPTQLTPTGDSLLYSLDTLAANHANILKVIATPAFEDNYIPARKNQLIDWYRTYLNSGIIITKAMYTRKSSGQLQHPLYQWLTTFSVNMRFDYDVEGPWHKYFVNATGQLYGILKPSTKIGSRAVNRTLLLQ